MGFEFNVFMIEFHIIHNYVGLAFGLDWNTMCKQPVEVSPGVIEEKYPPCRYIWVGFTLFFFNVSACIRPWGRPTNG